MSKIQWDSQLYLRYERERTQPSIDLVAKIDLESPEAIIDLGCGPGNSTRVLQERWPRSQITGLDSSTAMIEKARQSSGAIEWKVGDIQTWSEPDRFDLIFANASLHWLADHRTLTKRLLDAVKPWGILAFQMPALYNQPAAQAVHDLSESPKWKSYRLSERYILRTHTPGEYYDWLAPLSKQLHIWETVYFHEMANHDAIVEFYSSTGLKPYLEGLPSVELRNRFTESVLDTYERLFPTQSNGKVLFPFRRIFVIAARLV
jgi:trans-aconitate 2-methyltransferase